MPVRTSTPFGLALPFLAADAEVFAARGALSGIRASLMPMTSPTRLARDFGVVPFPRFAALATRSITFFILFGEALGVLDNRSFNCENQARTMPCDCAARRAP